MESSAKRSGYKTQAIEKLTAWANERGYVCQIEPTTEFCARIQLPNGRRHMLIGADLGLNRSAAKRIADDKSFASTFLQSDGIKTIETQMVGASDPVHTEVPYPLVVKPNRGYGGDGILLVTEERHLEIAVQYARRFDTIVLIQPHIRQQEFRIIVADGQCICAYERLLVRIHGDGVSTWRDLLTAAQPTSNTPSLNLNDSYVAVSLACQGLSLDDTSQDGLTISPIAGANLKLGARWRDANFVDPFYLQTAVRAAQALGLNVAGIDMFIREPALPKSDYAVIEVNANPGFEYLGQRPDEFERLINCVCNLIDRVENL